MLSIALIISPRRLHLTSHEHKRTKSDQPRRPALLPIAFPDLIWDQYAHIELLAASTNFLIHKLPNLVSSDPATKATSVSIFSSGFENFVC
jgi:hypothetical protein